MKALEGARRVGGCGRNWLNQCCIPGAKLPLYAFKKLNVNDGDTGLLGHEKREGGRRIACREDVTACETKVIPGQFGFIAQLNEGRHLKKRLTEFRVDKVLQPFDGCNFNFTEGGQEEVLFQFEASEDGEAQWVVGNNKIVKAYFSVYFSHLIQVESALRRKHYEEHVTLKKHVWRCSRKCEVL